MSPQTIFIATVAVALVNGLISPMFVVLWHLHPVWLPEMLPATQEIIYYGASLLVATGTLLISALPAALAERVFGAKLPTAMGVWLGAAVLLVALGLR